MMVHPYDTGEVAQPHIWDEEQLSFRRPDERDRIGQVDFDNDEDITVATVQVTRGADGAPTLHVWPHVDGLTIHAHDTNH